MITNKVAKKTWKETNKIRKEEKKKRKELKLSKSLAIELAAEADFDAKKEQKPENKQEISTISIAVPGSILDNAQSRELRTYLAGQIARAACMFQVDEIIVFDDLSQIPEKVRKGNIEDNEGSVKICSQSCIQLGRILQYLECPQYLRKHLFPIHSDLKFAGILNPLDSPHHLRVHNNFIFREGVVTNKPVKSGKGSLVNVGLLQDAHVDKLITPGIRCTVKLVPKEGDSKKLQGVVVAPSLPRRETGIYWGYTVRLATSLGQVFTQSPYKDGYDVTVGTSDKGSSVDELPQKSVRYQHLLVMFGGVMGLETALDAEETLQTDDPKLLFDYYLNTLPNQGSRTLRTEEAILVTMAALRGKLEPEVGLKEFVLHDEIAQSEETGVSATNMM